MLFKLLAGYKIITKDHPHDFGRKQQISTNKFTFIIVVVSTKTSVHDIISNASLVITIVGTASLEALLMKVPSLSAVKMYYSKLCVQETFEPENEYLTDILNKTKNWKNIEIALDLKKICVIFTQIDGDGNVGPIDMNQDILKKII